MVEIKNDKLSVKISPLGAEMYEIKGTNGVDYLFDNDEYWADHAPNLFPVIGRLNNYQYTKDGKTYEILQHGFAKTSTFKVVEENSDSATFELKANEETLSRYPYDFVFQVRYELTDNKIKISYITKNNSDEVMPYSVGGHPAFNVPLNGEGEYEDYTITLDPLADVDYYVSDPVPYLNGEKKAFEAVVDGVMPLRHETFYGGLIITDAAEVNSVTLSNSVNDHGVKVKVEEFPYVCFWTKDDVDAPFICIEPFHGLPDIYGEVGTLEEKEGMIFLDPNEEKTISFEIELF